MKAKEKVANQARMSVQAKMGAEEALFLEDYGGLAQSYFSKSNQIKSNQIKSNQIKSNQIKSNQIKSNQIKSNQIKPNQKINIKINMTILS